MSVKKYINPIFFYALGFFGFLISCFTIYAEGICSGKLGSSSPLDIFMMSLHWLLFTYLVAKIDPGYVAIRNSWFLIFLFYVVFTLFMSFGIRFTTSNIHLLMC